jgi:hypothetical protein
MKIQVPLIEVMLAGLSSALAGVLMSAEMAKPADKQAPPSSNVEKQRAKNFRFILDLEKQ